MTMLHGVRSLVTCRAYSLTFSALECRGEALKLDNNYYQHFINPLYSVV
jgi:hypothetical protein